MACLLIKQKYARPPWQAMGLSLIARLYAAKTTAGGVYGEVYDLFGDGVSADKKALVETHYWK